MISDVALWIALSSFASFAASALMMRHMFTRIYLAKIKSSEISEGCLNDLDARLKALEAPTP
jgi:hypothetical protein